MEKFLLGFPKAITDFVRGHVSAKRYLVAKRPGYYDRKYVSNLELLKHLRDSCSLYNSPVFECHSGKII